MFKGRGGLLVVVGGFVVVVFLLIYCFRLL